MRTLFFLNLEAHEVYRKVRWRVPPCNVRSGFASTKLGALDLEPLRGSAVSLHWDAPQFTQADSQGNVYLLRGDTLQVYPVSKAHDLGEPVPLEMSGARSGPTIDAAMSRDADWVARRGGGASFRQRT
jgi:hypothetical protein